MAQRSWKLWKTVQTMRWNTSLFSKHCEIRDQRARRFSRTASFSLVSSKRDGKSMRRTSKHFTKNAGVFSDLNKRSSSGFRVRKTSQVKNWSAEAVHKQTPTLPN